MAVGKKVFSTFYEQKKRKLFYENAVASALKSCIEKSRISFFFCEEFFISEKPGFFRAKNATVSK